MSAPFSSPGGVSQSGEAVGSGSPPPGPVPTTDGELIAAWKENTRVIGGYEEYRREEIDRQLARADAKIRRGLNDLKLAQQEAWHAGLFCGFLTGAFWASVAWALAWWLS